MTEFNIPKEDVSSELQDIAPVEQDELDSSLSSFLIQHQIESLPPEESIAEEIATPLDAAEMMRMAETQQTNERFVKQCAFKFLAAFEFYAKKHISEYALINGLYIKAYRQRIEKIDIKVWKEFSPLSYKIALHRREFIEDTPLVLAFNQPTMAEARTIGAMKIEFSKSPNFHKIWMIMPKLTAERLRENKDYLIKARVFLRLIEKRKQIKQYKGADYKTKLRWLNEIENEIHTMQIAEGF